MSKKLKDQIIEALKDQKEIFGDELFIPKSSRKTIIHKESKIETEQTELFPEAKEPWEASQSLDELDSLINTCTECTLHRNRNKFVFGSGNPNADVLVIGEGPGAEEDKQGLPFVGRAGNLLTDMLKAINFEREEVYIGNVVKCRPPGNRTPLPEEMDTCMPYLKKQIEIINPKLILCLGLTAAKALLNKRESLAKLRGQVYEFEGIPVMVTYHSAALLRNPHWKRDCWEDLKKFRRLYDEIVG